MKVRKSKRILAMLMVIAMIAAFLPFSIASGVSAAPEALTPVTDVATLPRPAAPSGTPTATTFEIANLLLNFDDNGDTITDFAVESAIDDESNPVSGVVLSGDNNRTLTYTPLVAQAGKVVTIVVSAENGIGSSDTNADNLTITVTVGAVQINYPPIVIMLDDIELLTADISEPPVRGDDTDDYDPPSIDDTDANFIAFGEWDDGVTDDEFDLTDVAVYKITLTAKPGYTFKDTDIEDGTPLDELFPLAHVVSVIPVSDTVIEIYISYGLLWITVNLDDLGVLTELSEPPVVGQARAAVSGPSIGVADPDLYTIDVSNGWTSGFDGSDNFELGPAVYTIILTVKDADNYTFADSDILGADKLDMTDPDGFSEAYGILVTLVPASDNASIKIEITYQVQPAIIELGTIINLAPYPYGATYGLRDISALPVENAPTSTVTAPAVARYSGYSGYAPGAAGWGSVTHFEDSGYATYTIVLTAIAPRSFDVTIPAALNNDTGSSTHFPLADEVEARLSAGDTILTIEITYELKEPDEIELTDLGLVDLLAVPFRGALVGSTAPDFEESGDGFEAVGRWTNVVSTPGGYAFGTVNAIYEIVVTAEYTHIFDEDTITLVALEFIFDNADTVAVDIDGRIITITITYTLRANAILFAQIEGIEDLEDHPYKGTAAAGLAPSIDSVANVYTAVSNGWVDGVSSGNFGITTAKYRITLTAAPTHEFNLTDITELKFNDEFDVATVTLPTPTATTIVVEFTYTLQTRVITLAEVLEAARADIISRPIQGAETLDVDTPSIGHKLGYYMSAGTWHSGVEDDDGKEVFDDLGEAVYRITLTATPDTHTFTGGGIASDSFTDVHFPRALDVNTTNNGATVTIDITYTTYAPQTFEEIIDDEDMIEAPPPGDYDFEKILVGIEASNVADTPTTVEDLIALFDLDVLFNNDMQLVVLCKDGVDVTDEDGKVVTTGKTIMITCDCCNDEDYYCTVYDMIVVVIMGDITGTGNTTIYDIRALVEHVQLALGETGSFATDPPLTGAFYLAASFTTSIELSIFDLRALVGLVSANPMES
jgi:hypothetical protein